MGSLGTLSLQLPFQTADVHLCSASTSSIFQMPASVKIDPKHKSTCTVNFVGILLVCQNFSVHKPSLLMHLTYLLTGN